MALWREGASLNFDHEWGCEGEEIILLDVSAEIGPGTPGSSPDLNHPGSEPEYGDIDGMEVTLPDGTILNPIPDALYQTLSDKAYEEIGAL